MNTYRCKYPRVTYERGTMTPRLTLVMIDDHKGPDGLSVELSFTSSELKMIDFERRYAVTQNGTYTWDDV